MGIIPVVRRNRLPNFILESSVVIEKSLPTDEQLND